MENYFKNRQLKSGRNRLWEMVFYESFNIKGVDWENFGDLDKVLIKGGY